MNWNFAFLVVEVVDKQAEEFILWKHFQPCLTFESGEHLVTARLKILAKVYEQYKTQAVNNSLVWLSHFLLIQIFSGKAWAK